ncbi:MAG: hypothetical protein KKF62_06925 [Bacteroidetes bacterium]|nr:hypothetical protein [Bacteroidota bacterium]MBU1116244.1 hypothetical protein [Bacteroidota bacterium]MBU1799956.1 hypothetical protein [Bacteroidota bacterium]
MNGNKWLEVELSNGIFNKFIQAITQEVITRLYQWFFKNLQFDNYTMDFDSSLLTRYGDQEGSKKGYNPKKKSHHLIIAFLYLLVPFW